MANNVNFTIRVTDGGTIRKVTVDASELQRVFNSVRSETKGVSKAMSSFEEQMKSYTRGVVAQYASVAAVAGTLIGVTKQAISTNMDFEKKSSELAAVLGKSKNEVSEMTEAAKELGRTTQYTATEVEELQIALARLGFSEREIGNMQESVLKFAAAVNTDLGSAADFAGSALRAFGLTSSDTGHLLDVMAASTSKSALDFHKLQQSISIVAPTAHSFGVSMEDTVALLGTLANAGFRAEAASTALRNIFLNLADENGKLAKGLGHTAKTFPEIIEALRECTEQGFSLSEVLEMTSMESVSAFSTLISGAGAAEELRAALDNCNGSLETMYKEMTDNLKGAVDSLKSAWEGWMLSMNNGEGTLANIITLGANLLNGITDLRETFKKLPSDIQDAYRELMPLGGFFNNVRRIGKLAGKANARFEARRTSGTGEEVYGEFVGPVFDPNKVVSGTTVPPGGQDPDSIKKFAEAIEAYRKSIQAAVQTNAVFNAGQGETAVQLKAMESGITALIAKYGAENSTVQGLIEEYRNLKAEMVGMSDPLPAIEHSSKLIASAVSETGLAARTTSQDIGIFVESISGVEAAQQALASVSSTFASLSDIVGEGAAAWLDWASNVVSAVGQAIPVIAALVQARRQEATANLAAGATGTLAAMASIPFVGPAMAIASVAGILAAVANLPKFASGAIAYGPTIGMFGEYPGAGNNPEVVAPLDRLRDIIGVQDTGMPRKLKFHIEGRDLVAVYDLETRRRSRVG